MLKRLFLTFLFSFSGYLHAKFPLGCESYPIGKENLSLTSPKPSVFLLQNISPEQAWLTHSSIKSSSNEDWTSSLQQKHWSAIFVQGGKNLELGCVESRPGHEQQLPCQGLIRLCLWTKLKLPRKLEKTNWIAEDLPLDILKTRLLEQGFQLKK